MKKTIYLISILTACFFQGQLFAQDGWFVEQLSSNACPELVSNCLSSSSIISLRLSPNQNADPSDELSCDWFAPNGDLILQQSDNALDGIMQFLVTGNDPITGLPYLCELGEYTAVIKNEATSWTITEVINLEESESVEISHQIERILEDGDCVEENILVSAQPVDPVEILFSNWWKVDYQTNPPTRILMSDPSSLVNESLLINRNDPAQGDGDYIFTFIGPSDFCISEKLISIAFIDYFCFADAGPDQVITCMNPKVTIDGSRSCGSAELIYEWIEEFSQIVVGNSPTIDVLAVGTYTLNITDSVTGCTDSDQVIVTDDLNIPSLSFEFLNGTGPVLSCASPVAEILATSNEPQAFFQWIFPSGITSNENPLITNEVGEYSLSTFNIENGCETITSFNLIADDDLCTKISGFAYHDLNDDCNRQMDEELIGSWLLKFDDGVEPLYRNVPASGAFEFGMFPGTYEISLVPLNAVWQSCPPVTVTINENEPIEMDFGIQSIFQCDMPVVEMIIPRLRRCVENPIYVCYSNEGSTDTEDAYIDVQIDEDHSVVSADFPFETINATQLRFQLGTLEPFDNGRIEIIVETGCDALFGKSHCFESEIFPQNDCFMSSDWDGSSLVVEGSQVDDKIRFEVTNIGNDMTTSVNGFIIEDDVLMRIVPIQLNAFNVEPIEVDCSSSTFRIEVEQSPNHPGMSFPTVTVEGCDGEFTPGLVNLYPQDNEDSFKDVVCRRNVDSFDPNDKLATPIGVSDANCIPPGRHLDYTIRFQNTGTAEALKVVITDEISENLDMSTLRITGASHDYTYFIDEGRTLTFTFDDIDLPWEAIDEPGSNGFIQYSIFPKENIELGSEVENYASIFFDFNEPIITNTTFHTIDVDCIEVNIVSSTSGQPINDSAVFPNPFKDAIIVVLENDNQETLTFKLFDVNGRLIEQFDFDSNQVYYETNKVQAGIYFYEISSTTNKLGSGKLIKI